MILITLIMKKAKNILKGLLALAIVFLFTQCTENKNTTPAPAAPAAGGSVEGMKIAYVEIDSLLTKYRFWNDLNELMIQKEENIRTTLNEKAKALDAAMRDFQRKYENNGFVSQESAQQQQARLMKQQQELQQLQEKLSKELADENQKINNKTKGYSLIISNSGFDNLLYADKAFDITQEIVDGLNARYTPNLKK